MTSSAADPPHPLVKQYGLMFDAVHRNKSDEVKSLLAQHPSLDINIAGGGPTGCSYHWNSLGMAASNNLGDMVKYLLTVPGIDVNQKSFNRTPFGHACVAGAVDGVAALLADDRVDVNITDSVGNSPFTGTSPLQWAAQKGHWKVACMILASKKIVNLKNGYDGGQMHTRTDNSFYSTLFDDVVRCYLTDRELAVAALRESMRMHGDGAIIDMIE